MYWLSTLAMFTLMIYLYRGTPDVPSIIYLLRSMSYTTWAYGKLPIIYPGWTLEYEMMFYLLVSFAMALSTRTWAWVIAAIATCVCGGIVADQLGVPSSRLLFFTNPMYLEFALGIIIAHFIVDRPLPVVAIISLIVAFGLIILSGPWDEWRWRVLVAGLPASIAVFCASWVDRRKLPLSRPGRLFARLGDASYSIYLVQAFVISIACKALAVATPRLPVDPAILIVSIATLLTAYGVHVGIEKPITRWIHRPNRLALKLNARGDQRAGSSL